MKLFKLSLIVLLTLFFASTGCMQDSNKSDNSLTRQDINIEAIYEVVTYQKNRIQQELSSNNTKKPTTELHIAAELGFYEFIMVWLIKNHQLTDFKHNINSRNHAFLTVKEVARYSMHKDIVQLIEKYEAK